MSEWEYIRLMSRNYLQIRCYRQQSEETFQYRMLTSEPIKGLLPCKEREVNGARYLLYDISSMQNLQSTYAEKKMDFAAFYQLIFSLKRAVKKLEEYLLDPANLLLCPEFMYLDIDTREMAFLYYPYSMDSDDTRKDFYTFLLLVVDHEDDELTELVYELYEKAEGMQSLSWLEEVYQQLGRIQEGRDGCMEKAQVQPEKNPFENEALFTNSEVQDNRVYDDCKNFRVEKPVSWRKRVLHILCLYVCAVVLLLYLVYSNFILTAAETAIIVGTLVVLTGGAVFLMYLRLKKEDTEDVKTSEKEESFTGCAEFGKRIEEVPVEDDYGKTIMLSAEENEIENKLYRIGKKGHETIELKKFPFTIGKKEGAVDAVLTDSSVSRMHARFFEQNHTLYLEDLNSTNGTYKNGRMLAPHEKVEILPEDEIRFGKLSFLYR